MGINKKIKPIVLSVGFLYMGLMSISDSYANFNINEVHKGDKSVEFEITTGDDSKYIVLPSGNKIKKDTVKFISSANGTYTFANYLNDNTHTEKSISVTNLRAKYLVTSNPNVKLELSSEDTLSGVENMRFKNELAGVWSAFEPYKTEKDWTLINSDGEKTVYAQYQDKAGNISDEVTDTIYLDLIGPVSTLFKINNGAKYTNDENVKLSVNATDNYSSVSKMMFSNNNSNFTEFDYATEADWTLPDSDGTHTVYLKLKDGVGNIGSDSGSSINRASIILDKTLPSGTIDIIEAIQNDAGEFIVPSPEVTLNLQTFDALSGVKEVNLYEGNHKMTLPKVPPNNVNQTISWRLNTDTPSTFITLEVIDNAGNVYRTDSITVTILSLKVVDFYLDNVFNPKVFKDKFDRLSWYGSDEANERPAGFPRQPMLAGGDIDFSLKYDMNDSVLSSYDMTWKYIVTVTKPGEDPANSSSSTVYESEDFVVSEEEKSSRLLKGKYKIPFNTEKGSVVSIQVELNASCHTISGGTFAQSAIFPIGGGKAQIGEVLGDVREDIKFNEIE